MDISLTPEQAAMSPTRELAAGEWQMWCIECGYRFPKNAAAKRECPNCGNTRLAIAKAEVMSDELGMSEPMTAARRQGMRERDGATVKRDAHGQFYCLMPQVEAESDVAIDRHDLLIENAQLWKALGNGGRAMMEECNALRAALDYLTRAASFDDEWRPLDCYTMSQPTPQTAAVIAESIERLAAADREERRLKPSS